MQPCLILLEIRIRIRIRQTCRVTLVEWMTRCCRRTRVNACVLFRLDPCQYIIKGLMIYCCMTTTLLLKDAWHVLGLHILGIKWYRVFPLLIMLYVGVIKDTSTRLLIRFLVTIYILVWKNEFITIWSNWLHIIFPAGLSVRVSPQREGKLSYDQTGLMCC